MRRGLGPVVLVALVSVPAAAQQPEPSVGDAADRPGFADTPVLLAPGQIQVEAGFTWERNDPGAELTKTSTWPQIELHSGITPRVEVSLAWDGLVSVAAPGSTTNAAERSTGLADVRLGAKFGLVNRPRVNAALIVYGNLPVGSEAFSSHYADPRTRFAWATSISDRVGLSGTVDLGSAREEDTRVRAKPAASLSLGTRVVRTLNGFVGIVDESPEAGSTPDVWSVEAGAVLAVGVRTQIDLWVNRRVSGGPDNWFIGGGVARRLR
jgi:Putative MetA-pathway of phenol degradation